MKFLLYLFISIFVSIFFYSLSIFFSITTREVVEESSFECGLNVSLSIRVPFSFQFFLVAILFLVFDVEVSLILPFSIETWMVWRSNGIFIIFFILVVGLRYEWKSGKIN